MEYGLFFGGIALIVLAYLIYKVFKWSNLAPNDKYLKTALRLNSLGLVLMSVSAGMFFIVECLVG
jgi:hypothetical protein